jgi:hypothetical protein
MTPTLPAAVADDANHRTTSLERATMKREVMEAVLREEINLAVYQYPNFVDEFLSIRDKARYRGILNELVTAPLFRHNDNDWSVDCDALDGPEDTVTHVAAALILDTISQAAFRPDQFRPVHREVVPLGHQPMRADDPNDTDTVPDIIQAETGPDGTRHWANAEFFAECKGRSKATGSKEQISKALLQLARYARATLIHQIHRRHVFSVAICGAEAIFVRLGRTSILHSPPIDLRTSFKQFALAAAGLFALDPEGFGYDTRFYFWPPLTGLANDHAVSRELRVKAERKRWTVMEIICQRKCLVGRATLVLLLSRVTSRKHRAVLKSIWRDQSRTDEGENLAEFKGCPGICQCRWSQSGGSTAVHDKDAMSPSPYMKSFYPPLPKEQVDKLRSSTSAKSSTSSRNLTSSVSRAKHQQYRTAPPEDRIHSMILMDEGVGLWRVKRLPHVLKVLRDGLVGEY